MARRVSREDKEEISNGQYEGMENSFRKPDNQTLQNEIKALRDLLERAMLHDSKPATLTAQSTGCYFCGDKSHFKRDCPKRSRSPSPMRRQDTGADCERRPVYQIGRGQDLLSPIQVNGNKVDAIVDTGADVTVLSRSFANCIGLSGTTGIKACLLNAENGKEMEADMNVVAKLQLDLLKEVYGVIMAGQGDLLIKNELIPGRYRKENDCRISGVTVESETTLKPMAETDVFGGVESQKEVLLMFWTQLTKRLQHLVRFNWKLT
ncbi:unnamed protein product [Mytilus edulis]|uniref:CCHC-type domain-containing protein n=1 Tax=Mytilus edulis TaxID=6550 RepID=A0A8S3PR73_MYTED|nr:unnamed protein product [Mytilus edulis]